MANIVKKIACVSFACLTLCAFQLNAAQDRGIELGKVELYPTFECVGIRAAYTGDADSNATVAVRYRLRNTTQWREAQPLCRIKDSRFAGSIFFLTPGQEYEVELTASDPDGGGTKKARVSTRNDGFPVGTSGRQLWVDPAGDDANRGSVASPLRTIRQAAELAQPGDIVRVNPGVYREQVKVSTSGRRDAYVAFMANGKGVVLSGADQRYDRPSGGGAWNDEGGGIYSTNPGYATRFVAAGEQRLYHYLTRDEFDQFICGAPGGWYQDEATGKLYLKLTSGDSPAAMPVQIASLDTGFHVSGADYVLIEGFEVRDYGRESSGAGVHLDSSSWSVVRNCSVHGMNSKIRLSGGAECEGNLVERCLLWDTSLTGWPWDMTKSHDEEGGGVMSTGGRGTVVRGCKMYGVFDGLAPSFWGGLWDEDYNCDWDVYDNEISNARDDIIEPEGPCINFRFWNNLCHDLFVGVSLAPINVGPIYVMYNSIYELKFKNLKYGGYAPGTCYLFHNTIYSGSTLHNLVHISRPFDHQVFRNNVFFANTHCIFSNQAPTALNDIDYNAWYSSDVQWFTSYTGVKVKRLFRFGRADYGTIGQLRSALGWEQHGVGSDPLLTDPAAGKLYLQPGSPCIDAGQVLPNINDSYAGSEPDIGAFEFGGRASGPFPLGRSGY
jgi:parallel beta helix pectate lyase-like protein/uncharacterized protein DUF1565